MPNSCFSFKQFTIHHDRCAMKVGTDGVLLGAWTRLDNSRRVLDIGTGSGLIALMLAQRNACCSITAVDIDNEAIEQARENIQASPWKDRVVALLQDVRSFQSDHLFDTIVTNPPYFVNSMKCADYQKNIARHADTLDVGTLLSQVAALLTPDGCFSIVLPSEQMDVLLQKANGVGLYPSRRTDVITRPGIPPKRVLLEFTRVQMPFLTDELVIELGRHCYSEEYVSLTKEFYLKF